MVSLGRPAPDQALVDIAAYAGAYRVDNPRALRIARYCLIDALGGAVEALSIPDCTRFLGPVVPELTCPGGARVPGTTFELDPVTAAFNLAAMIRWLDFNDGLSTDQGGHPSDNIGGIFTLGDYLNRNAAARRGPSLLMRDVLAVIVKSYEIQGVLSLSNNFVRRGYDYVILPKVAMTAVATQMLGGSRNQIVNAVSNALADGVGLTIFRQGDNTGPRMCWAGGDAAGRAVQLALMAIKGDMGYPSVLTARTYGFYDAFLHGKPLQFPREYADHVIEHLVMFKFIPASVQAQSAGECARRLHPVVKDRLEDIDRITLKSHERMIRGLDKKGPLTSAADRTHCVQYVIAVLLIHGRMSTSDFNGDFAADPRIDRLRDKMLVQEEPRYTSDFNDPAKRSNTQSLEIRFKDGSGPPSVEIEYPPGYPPLRDQDFALVEEKFREHLRHRYAVPKQQAILTCCLDQAKLEQMPVDAFMDLLV